METKGWKSFWTALWVSLLVLLPLVAGTAVLAQRQAAGRVRASESQSGVPVQLPCPASWPSPSATGKPLWPTVMRRPGRPGACRAWARWWTCLRTPAIWPPPPRPWPASATPMAACGWVFRGFCRRDQTGVRDWDGASAHAFLQELADSLAPDTAAAARAAVWDAFFRQNLEALPAALPDSLREASGSLLTDLTAADLLTLEDTLELLANNGAVVESSVLPGRTDRRSGLYVLGEEAGPAVQAFFNVADSAPASGTQSASSSAPYPSTSVPGGQPAGPSM